MGTVGLIFTLMLLAGCVGIVGYVAYCYLTAPKTIVAKSSLNPEDPPEMRETNTLDKMIYATKKSSTLFVQLAVGFFTMFGNAILNMADFFGAPEVRTWVTENLTPSVASSVIVMLVGITVWARFRKE